jgi:hypothetical protein
MGAGIDPQREGELLADLAGDSGSAASN